MGRTFYQAGMAEGIPRSDLIDSGGAAGYYGSCLVSGSKTIITLREGDVPGASLNGRDPSKLHVVEFKGWLKCRGATTAGRKVDLVKRLAKKLTVARMTKWLLKILVLLDFFFFFLIGFVFNGFSFINSVLIFVIRVRDYISSGLNSKIIDPDGGVHVKRLRANIKQILPY